MKKIIIIIGVLSLIFFGFTSNKSDNKPNTFKEYNVEIESELKLEDWMVSNWVFTPIKNDVDEPLEIEDWMIDPKYFD